MKKISKRNILLLGLITVTFFPLRGDECCHPSIDWNSEAQGWYRLARDGTRVFDVWNPSEGYQTTGGLVFSPETETIFYDGFLGLPESNICLLVKPEKNEIPKISIWWLDHKGAESCIEGCRLIIFPEVSYGTPVGQGWFLYKFPWSTTHGPRCKFRAAFAIHVVHKERVIVDNLGQVIECEDEVDRKRWFSAHLGLAIPFGDLKSRHKNGYSVTIDMAIPLKLMKIKYYLVHFLGYVNFPPNQKYNKHKWFLHYSINFKYYPLAAKPSLYFEFGPGIYYQKDNVVDVGWNIGVGYDYPLSISSILLEVGADYHNVYTPEISNWLNIHAGVVIKF